MRPIRFELDGHRSAIEVSFDAGRFTVLFGKNNAGKSNILEAAYGVLAGEPLDMRRPVSERHPQVVGGLWVELEPGLPFDEKAALAAGLDLDDPDQRRVRLASDGVEAVDPDPFGDDPDSYEDLIFDSIHGERLSQGLLK